MLILVTKDLFFVPHFSSAATRAGVEMLTVFNLDSPKLAELDASSIRTCVIDLAQNSAAGVLDAVQQLRARFPAARIAAFGPHVQAGLLTAARDAGCDQVLTRGQLNAQIDELVQHWGQG